MSYFIFSRTTGLFVTETDSAIVLRCYPASEYEVVTSIHGY